MLRTQLFRVFVSRRLKRKVAKMDEEIRRSGHAVAEPEHPLPPREYAPARADISQLGALADLEKLTVVSYNILSQLGARRLERSENGYVDRALLSILQRRERIFREIMSYDADVICFQEIDDHEDFWAWKLTECGYDSVFALHPGKTAREEGSLLEAGLAIAFRKEVFQLFKTVELDLNDITQSMTDDNLIARSQQDCIALCVQLQPWEQSKLPSAVCIITTQLAAGGDTAAMDEVRVLQTEYLCREIAKINAVSNLPIVLAGTFNALPSSDVYHVVSTGRRRPRPRVPRVMDRPEEQEATPTTITISWTPPQCGDSSIIGYKIAVKNCTSATLGFSMHELIIDGDSSTCQYTITMLSSGIPYQFRIAARNIHGYGEFSQPSLPIVTAKSAKLHGGVDHDIDDNSVLDLPVFIADEIPPRVKPYDPTFGSGRTPRYESGEVNMRVSPRKLLVSQDIDRNAFSTLQPRGDRDDELVHGEQLESAYAMYQGYISEPEFTYSSPRVIGTIDYIFFSATQFEPFQLLSMPTLEELDELGVDIRQDASMREQEWAKYRPRGWRDTIGTGKNDEAMYMGEWIAPTVANTYRRQNPWLPNRVYPSDHLALGCVLALKHENIAVQWN